MTQTETGRPTEYRDDGCHVSPSCITCPLPACIYDLGLVKGGKPGVLTDGRAAEIREVYRQALAAGVGKGEAQAEIAKRYGVTPRTVRRALG